MKGKGKDYYKEARKAPRLEEPVKLQQNPF